MGFCHGHERCGGIICSGLSARARASIFAGVGSRVRSRVGSSLGWGGSLRGGGSWESYEALDSGSREYTTTQRTDGDTAGKAGRRVDLGGRSLVIASALLRDVAVEGVEAGLAESWDIGWVGLLAFWGQLGSDSSGGFAGSYPRAAIKQAGGVARATRAKAARATMKYEACILVSVNSKARANWTIENERSL